MPKKPKPYRLHLSEWLAIRRSCEAARATAFAAVQHTEGVSVIAFQGYTLLGTKDDRSDYCITVRTPTLDDTMSVVQRMIDLGVSRIRAEGVVVGAPDGRFLANNLPTTRQEFGIEIWNRHDETGEPA